MLDFEFNLAAIVAGAVASFVIGMAWYSPLLFGKVWQKLNNYTNEDLKGAGPAMAANVVASFVVSFVMLQITIAMQAIKWHEGLQVGLLVSVGLVSMLGINQIVFSKKPLPLYFIDYGFIVVSLVAMAVLDSLIALNP